MKALETMAIVKTIRTLLAKGGTNNEWCKHLARLRLRRGRTIWRRSHPKFIEEATQLIGLQEAGVVATPMTPDLAKDDDGDPLEEAGKKKIQHVMGLLNYVVPDFPSALFAWRCISLRGVYVEAP